MPSSTSFVTPVSAWSHIQPVTLKPELSRKLWDKFIIYTPKLKTNDIRVYWNKSIIDMAKAKMTALGVKDISEFGNITLPSSFSIKQGGLIANRTFIRNKRLPLVTGVVLPNPMLMARISGWVQYESVILADELDFTNKTITIDRDHVSCLYIIARKIKARPNAKITYRPLTNPNQGKRGSNGKNGASFDRYNSHHNNHHAPDGGNGTKGEDGREGPAGVDAPDLKIYVLEMEGMPDIILPGQKGGQGGRGGNGGNGGNGERGRNSKKKTFLGVPVDCSNGPGWGGNGGKGGDGGKGGKGGKGGDGANVLIATLAENLTSMITGGAFKIDISGGSGGDHGVQGNEGRGGRGGLPGRNTAGWPCRDEPGRDGKDGQPGKKTGYLGNGDAGSVGTIEFPTLTREEWELKLEAPWIENIMPNTGFPDVSVNINGVNLIRGSKVHYFPHGLPSALKQLNTDYVSGEKLIFKIPLDTVHGEHRVKVVAPDGDTSNEVPFHVRPHIDVIEVDGQSVSTVSPGDTILIRGKALSPECSILYREQWHTPDKVEHESTITFTLEATEGDDPGGMTNILVRNEDGRRSNAIRLRILPVLDSGFRAGLNGYAFRNFTKGKPDWNAFRATFEDPEEIIGEVDEEMISNPVLTLAFYHLLFKPYLNGDLGGAFCSALSETSLRRFHQGIENVFSLYTNTTADPPPIPNDLMRELVCAQGRMLSEEIITHYYNQGEQGVDQVGNTIKSVESDIRDGRGVDTARTVSFIPSGNIWDSDFFNNLKRSHTVVPTRLVYPDEHRSLAGAKLYIYDPNHVGDDSRVIELYEKQGKLHFKYPGYSSENGFTLGTATLNLSLLKDVDLPFSLGFILDILTCPAWLRLEDDTGNFLGYKDGKIHTNPELGLVSPFIENYILSREDSEKSFKRVIEGKGKGKYHFATFHPEHRSISLDDIDINEGTKDTLNIDHAFSKIELISTDAQKQFNLRLGAATGHDIKITTATFSTKKDEAVGIEIQPEMASIVFKTPQRVIDVDLELLRIAGAKVDSVSQKVNLKAKENLELNIGDWANLTGTLRFNKIVTP